MNHRFAVRSVCIQLSMFIAIGILIVTAFHHFVPYNMDEFTRFIQLRCWHSSLSSYIPMCQRWDLILPGTHTPLPLRSFFYGGSIPSFYYLPLYSVWHSPASARFLGYLFLGLQAYILSQLYRIPVWKILIGLLLFFPYFFSHLVDTGLVQFQTTSIFAIALLSAHWCTRRSLRYPLLIGLLLFLNFWNKLTFLWLLPGAVCVIGIQMIEHKKTLFASEWKRVAFQGLLGAGFALIGMGLLLLSSSPHESGMPLLDWLLSSNIRPLSSLFPHPLTNLLLSPLLATHYLFDSAAPGIFEILQGILLYFVFPLIFLTLLIPKYRHIPLWRPAAFYVLFLLTLIIIFLTKQSWAMHHVVLAFPFFILFVIELLLCLNRPCIPSTLLHRVLLCLAATSFLVSNSHAFATFTKQQVDPTNDSSKLDLLNVLNNEYVSQHYLYAHLDWGTYFFTSLYENRNSLSIAPEYSDVHFLKERATQTHRKMLFIYNTANSESSMGILREHFPLSRCKVIDPDAIWQIAMEPDSNEHNICNEGYINK